MRNAFDPSSEEGTGKTGSLSDPELPADRPLRPSKRVHATNTEHGFVNLYLIAICSESMTNQLIDQ
jgi:hypothetical protein